MKKEDELSYINHLIIVLNNHIQKLERAYHRKDHKEFNTIKKEILMIQNKIHSLVE